MHLQEIYIDLKKKISGQKDSLILVRKETEEINSSSLPPKKYFDPEDIGRRVTLEIGVMFSSPKFDEERDRIIIPTIRHLRKREGYDWELKKGNISIYWFEAFEYQEKIHHRELPLIEPKDIQTALWFYLGDEIKKYFHRDRDTEYMGALRLLEIKIPRDLMLRYETQTMR
ncbi:hypothetical protein HYV89_04900 [Candidatus Woesearchaeota archaeon]|nr:hypothetical protein [Candidatus Woesearchaeota archaeon]